MQAILQKSRSFMYEKKMFFTIVKYLISIQE